MFKDLPEESAIMKARRMIAEERKFNSSPGPLSAASDGRLF